MKENLLKGFIPPHRLSGMAADTPVLAALSGGADSAALLFLLAKYAKNSGTPLSVAHVDHKLRGADSDRDREFCRSLAARYGLPFYLLEEDVAALAETNHRGMEEQARLVRYTFFADLMKKHGIPLLATAHNADDNAETVLFHMARGSGLRGLCGIPPSRDFSVGKLIRPLLSVSKADILAFCQQNAIAYVTDMTNADVTYTRNRIRHNVLPELQTVNGGTLDNMTRLCTALRWDEDYLANAATDFLARVESEGAIPLAEINATHPAIASRAVIAMLLRLTDDVRAVHVDAVLDLAQAGVAHSSRDLGNGAWVVVENGNLLFSVKQPDQPAAYFRYTLTEGENLIPEADMMILIQKDASSHKSHIPSKNIYKKSTTTRLNFDRISGSLIAEPRKEGETVMSHGMHKKVKKLMCDCKVPLSLRERLPILKDGNGILWIPTVTARDGASDKDGAMTVTLYYND